jgi:hypothetical protein
MRFDVAKIIPAPDAETANGNRETDRGVAQGQGDKVCGCHFMKVNAVKSTENYSNKDERWCHAPAAARN